MVSLAKIDETMSIYVKPQTHPLAIRMLHNEDEVPSDAKNPAKDYGAVFTLCQALALSRMEGLTIVLDRESQSCPIALSGLGFVNPEGYLSGRYALAPTHQPAETRKKMAASLPRFPFGKYRYILISPIKTARFDPAAVLFSGNGAQV